MISGPGRGVGRARPNAAEVQPFHRDAALERFAEVRDALADGYGRKL